MKKVLSAFLAVATIAGSLAATTPAAQAQHRHGHHHGHHGHHGHGGAAIGLGLLGGAIAGAAIANSGGYYGPGYGYYGGCYMQRERFWDGYGWRVRRVQVCD